MVTFVVGEGEGDASNEPAQEPSAVARALDVVRPLRILGVVHGVT